MRDWTEATPFTVAGLHIDPVAGEATLDGEPVRVEPRLVDVLAYLVRRSGELVSRRELTESCIPGAGDSALTQVISALRSLLGDSAQSPCIIRTVPKRGYCFVGEVVWGRRPTARAWHRNIRPAARFAVVGTVGVLAIANAFLSFPADPSPDISSQHPVADFTDPDPDYDFDLDPALDPDPDFDIDLGDPDPDW